MWTKEDQARWWAEQDAYHQSMAWRSALRQRCRYHENWPLTRLARWWYTLKVVLCILLGLRGDLWASSDAVDAVAIWDQRKGVGEYSNEYDWAELAVGHGVFAGWVWDWYENSSY